MERAGEVLSVTGVDARLAADRRVDHPDERRRHGHPRGRREDTSPRRSPRHRSSSRRRNPRSNRRGRSASSLHRRSTTASVFASSPLGTTWVVAGAELQFVQRAATRLVDDRAQRCSGSSAVARASPTRSDARRSDSRRLRLGLRRLGRRVAHARRRAARTALGPERVDGRIHRRAPRRCRRRPATHATNAVRARALSGLLGENGSAAESDHRRSGLRAPRATTCVFDPAELGLAALEELADRAEALLDLLVECRRTGGASGARARGRASTCPRP